MDDREKPDPMNDFRTYVRDGAAIYAESFATIRREADFSAFSPEEAKVVVRMIHACGMVDLPGDVRFGAGFVAAARAALLAGKPVLCDSEMVAHGITRARLPASNEVICTLRVAGNAGAGGQDRQYALGGGTRFMGRADGGRGGGHRQCADRVVPFAGAAGCGRTAPGGDYRDSGGFVGAAESKAALEADGRVPFVVVHGRRGGSAMAAAAVNALASEAE